MTNEQTLEIVKSYIDEIQTMEKQHDLSVNERQHLRRALSVYKDLYADAEQGKIDPLMLHENITSFMYYIQ